MISECSFTQAQRGHVSRKEITLGSAFGVKDVKTWLNLMSILIALTSLVPKTIFLCRNLLTEKNPTDDLFCNW